MQYITVGYIPVQGSVVKWRISILMEAKSPVCVTKRIIVHPITLPQNSAVLYCVLFTVYCILCTVYCVMCIVYCVLCTVYSIQYYTVLMSRTKRLQYKVDIISREQFVLNLPISKSTHLKISSSKLHLILQHTNRKGKHIVLIFLSTINTC